MKNILLLICTLPLILAAQNKQEISTKIEAVTVYYQGAVVTRNANKVNIPASKTDLVVKGITAVADLSTLQAGGTGDNDFTILNVNPVPNYFREKESRDSIDLLDKRLKLVNEKITDNTNIRNVYLTERNLILANQSIKGTDAVLTVDQLRSMADFFRTRIAEVDNKMLEIDRDVNKLQEDKRKLELQLRALAANANSMTYDIIITVDAPRATSANLFVKYAVVTAGWFANYNVDVKATNKPLDLLLKASVSQTSGEDWKNVNLTLSTGSPSINLNKPTLLPWYLTFNTPAYTRNDGYGSNPNPYLNKARGLVRDAQTGEALPGAMITVKGTGIGAMTDLNGNFEISLPANSPPLIISYIGYTTLEMYGTANNTYNLQPSFAQLESVVIMSDGESTRGTLFKGRNKESKTPDYGYVGDNANYKVKQTATATQTATPVNYTYTIKEQYTILSNGKANTVGIKEYTIPAYYEHYCAPKLDKDVFLTALVNDWEQYELIDGEANIYFENTFIGKSLLSLSTTKDTLEISLGRDKNIVVDIVKTKDFTKRQVLGNNQIDRRAYDISIKNKKQTEVNLVLQDRMPIPKNNDITVEYENTAGAEFNKETGILTWRLKLAASQDTKVSPAYSVKYPKNQVIYLE